MVISSRSYGRLKFPYNPQQLNDYRSTFFSEDARSKFFEKRLRSEKLNCNKSYQVDTCRKGKIEKKTMQPIISQKNACGKSYAECAHKMAHFY